FRLFTLGCKVNQYETETIRSALLRHGYVEAEDDRIADLVVVNTCTVTAESEAKSRKVVRKLISENPGAQVVVMGCAATHRPDSMLRIDGVSQVMTDKQQIPDLLRQLGVQVPYGGIDSFGERHRAFIKIQDGCQVGCAYCIIPKVRPTLQSRNIEDVLPEIQTLARKGYREMVLTGIHLGHYGIDLASTHSLHPSPLPEGEGTNLAELVRRAVDLPEVFRLRLSSLEAIEVTNELIDLMLRYPDRICPHLHLSMQSGSDAVLRRMKRRWLSEPFVKRCEEILSRFDRLALTTDVIVGFPGETAEQFDETCRIVERLRFSKVHVFRFSPRQGTEAADLSNPVSPSEQKRRSATLSALADKLRTDFAASLVGSQETVLLETATSGTCGRYFDVRLNQPSEPGTLVAVQVERNEGEICFAKIERMKNSLLTD
ncbi:MAG: tRNA (N(6)-L-threonylcarbamoyladenosine(37)-C(2))-methylthiotransferase MtaB, partial [Planctomycetaceae bacterium]|nr:tRNA (N(6)-L-threonylcarbamoyladenosine(37)-C(2))-methylthiotransferase MtaB [Planctomycetaceae bacterium]